MLTGAARLPRDCDSMHIAYVHVPKAAGDALLLSLQQSHVPTCDARSANGVRLTNCDCLADRAGCARNVSVAVGEMSHLMLRDEAMPSGWEAGCTVWFAAIRDPRAWFYSAAAQWCRSTQRAAGCRSNDTLVDLRAANWFRPLRHDEPFRLDGKPRQGSSDSSGKTAYWFRHANLQTRMISSMFAESSWVICETARMPLLIAAMAAVLQTPLHAPQKYHTRSSSIGSGVRWATHVPWEKVQHMYELDEQLFRNVNSSGGGLWHFHAPPLVIAPS